jgi:hypothetical protein
MYLFYKSNYEKLIIYVTFSTGFIYLIGVHSIYKSKFKTVAYFIQILNVLFILFIPVLFIIFFGVPVQD